MRTLITNLKTRKKDQIIERKKSSVRSITSCLNCLKSFIKKRRKIHQQALQKLVEKQLKPTRSIVMMKVVVVVLHVYIYIKIYMD